MKIIKADLIKPRFNEIKETWSKLLSGYFDNTGKLKSIYIDDVPCPFCGSAEFREEFTINGFRHVRCNKCQVLYVSPRLKESCLTKLYSDEYYNKMFGDSMISVFDTRKELIGQSKFEQITKYFVKPGKVLDIGCGIGEVLSVFKDNEWECLGIEMNPSAIDWLMGQGINVFSGNFESFSVEELFDCVMAWNVIEHVVDPKAFLNKAFNHLRKGGYFVTEVPSGESTLVDYTRLTSKDPGRIIMGEQHIVLYTLAAYKKLHENAGFKLIKLWTNGLDIETIMKMNLQNISQEVISELQAVVDINLKGDLIRGVWKKP